MIKKLLREKLQNKIAEVINFYQFILKHLSFIFLPELKLMFHE